MARRLVLLFVLLIDNLLFSLVPVYLLFHLIMFQVLPRVPVLHESTSILEGFFYLWLIPLEMLTPFILITGLVTISVAVALPIASLWIWRAERVGHKLLVGVLAVQGAAQTLSLALMLFFSLLSDPSELPRDVLLVSTRGGFSLTVVGFHYWYLFKRTGHAWGSI